MANIFNDDFRDFLLIAFVSKKTDHLTFFNNSTKHTWCGGSAKSVFPIPASGSGGSGRNASRPWPEMCKRGCPSAFYLPIFNP